MKVLLIQPPFTILKNESRKCHPPLGLAYLASAIQKDHQVKVLDALADGYDNQRPLGDGYIRYGLSFEDIKKRIEAFSPDAVGISCLFSTQAENVHTICRLVKDIDRHTLTILGGAHPSALPSETLEDINVDFVVMGEGETALRRLLDAQQMNRDIGEIEGIGYRNGGNIKINQNARCGADVDEIPFPGWEIFPLERYFKINNPHGSPAKKTPFLPVFTSRGCPFECVFCSIAGLWGKRYRARSAQNVLEEIEYLAGRFGLKEIMFEDDNLIFDKARASQIFRGMIEKRMRMAWSTPNGITADALDDKLLELMKESGCYAISLGIESGDERILKDMVKKPVTISKAQRCIRKAQDLGMETSVFFVAGFPGETPRQLKNTFRAAESLRADSVNFFFATPLPGTRLLEICRQKGLVGEKLDYDRMKSQRPYFNTGGMSVGRLARMVFIERLKLYLLYFLNHPVKFLHKLRKKYDQR